MAARSPLVLIVDDNRDSAEMYALSLSDTGYQVRIADTAAEGFMQASEFNPDAVIVDVGLLGASGLDLIRWLRRDEATRESTIVVLTGYTQPEVEARALDAGCDRFLLKPCLPELLRDAIQLGLKDRPRPNIASQPARTLSTAFTRASGSIGF